MLSEKLERQHIAGSNAPIYFEALLAHKLYICRGHHLLGVQLCLQGLHLLAQSLGGLTTRGTSGF